MDLGIRNRVALVAAASQGLGKGSAAALAGEGVKVAILSRRSEELQRTAVEIGAALAVACDLSNKDSIANAVSQVQSQLGPIDILVNNCGGPPPGTFDSVTEEQWDAAYQQVFLSALRLTRAVLPGMRARRWGRIINIVSTSVEQPIPGLIVSNAFRPALAGWAKTLSAEVAADNVLVHCVSPGRILTARSESIDLAAAAKTGVTVDAIRAERSAGVPLRRYGTIEEFGAAVAFLASEKATYMTGDVIRVDGGAVSAI
ncbi:MAG: SDR family oxidoreductase [Candidatus Solibacter usitatus]|nr:SDR family oxidoreductase [Candidatus Solibacter usitatus]